MALRIIATLIAIMASLPSHALVRHGKVGGGGSVATLSSAVAIADGTDHAQIQVQTDTASGTLFYAGSTSCGLSPTAAQVKNGTVTGTVVSSNQAISGTGKQNANPAGLSSVTAYCFYFVQNTTGGDSAVAATSSFSTPGTLTFNPTTTAAFNAAQGGAFGAVLTNVVNFINSCFTASTNFTYADYKYDYVGGTGGAAITFTVNANPFYDTQLLPALQGLPGQSTFYNQAFSALPGTDPVGTNLTWVACFHGKAIGVAAGGMAVCGTTQTVTNVDNGITFDTTADGQTDPSGQISLWQVLWHETTEGMGRKSGILDGDGHANTVDMMSYSSAGVRNVTTTGNRYPSHDGGTTNDISANSLNQGGSDKGDESGAVTSAFLVSGPGTVAAPAILQDIKYMQLVGWGLTHSCRVTWGFTNLNWLLKRDVDPAANDNSPMFLNAAA